MNEVEHLLEQAQGLLLDPDNWTTGSLALDRHGQCVDPQAPSARAWCVLGAVARFDPDRQAVMHATKGAGYVFSRTGKDAIHRLAYAAGEVWEKYHDSFLEVDYDDDSAQSAVYNVNDTDGFSIMHEMLEKALKSFHDGTPR